MIHLFNTSRLKFPVKWANAITRWITGLTSDGSITIKNTANPTENEGPTLAVNTEWLRSILQGMTTPSNMDISAIYGAGKTIDPLTLTRTGTGDDLAPTDMSTKSTDYRKDKWSFGTACGLKNGSPISFADGDKFRGVQFDVLTRSVYESGGKDFLYFRTITISPLGVITNVSEENKCIAVRDIRFE